MSGAAVGEAVAEALEATGTLVQLRRILGNGLYFEALVWARERGYRPEELVGGIVQGDREVTISNREIGLRAWPGPPRRGDQLILDGRTFTVQSCDSANVSGEAVRHIMVARGAT